MRVRGVLVAMLTLMAGCTAIFNLSDVSSVDSDNDNIEDRADNCPDTPNADQSDFDMDGAGDRCDTCDDGGGEDMDADGIPDSCDGCVGTGEDLDDDSIDDGCDRCIAIGPDDDNDGVNDACDPCVFQSGEDVDQDTIDDACDQCIASGRDVDADLIDDACDPCLTMVHVDSDGDGLEDDCDPCNAASNVDTDLDGIPDGCDTCIGCAACNGATGFDEDRDSIDDGCDTCKLVHSPGITLDTDLDGVGDDCDLPSGTGSTSPHTEVFDSFNGVNTAWYQQGSGWSYVTSDGAMHVIANGETFRHYGRGADNVSVSATFAIPALTGAFSFGVFISSDQIQPGQSLASCGIMKVGNVGGTTLRLLVQDTPSNIVAQQSVPVSLISKQRYRLVLLVSKNTHTCRLREVAQDLPIEELVDNVSQLTFTEWYGGIAAASGSVTFHGYSFIH